MLRKFYGKVIIRFESGKVTHVGNETRRMWRYQDLPGETGLQPLEATMRHNRGAVPVSSPHRPQLNVAGCPQNRGAQAR